MITVRIASRDDEINWNHYVSEKSGTSSSHYYGWLRAVENSYGHSSYHLMAEACGRIVGVLPLTYMKIPFGRGQLVSLPYCDECDMIAETEQAGNVLIHKAIQIAIELKAEVIELRGDSFFRYLSELNLPFNALSEKVRLVQDLPLSSKELWKNFKSKLRSQIKKAEKNGLIFKWAGREDLSDFYRVFSVNMRDLGSPVHAKRWFENLFAYYGDKINIGLVYRGKLPVGGGVILDAGKKAQILWASTLRGYNHLAPNMLLYWKLLEYASDNGYTHFDFGRSTPGEGTYRFKLQWGAAPVPLTWYRIYMDESKGCCTKSRSGVRDIVTVMWRHLPLPAANFIGPKIRGYISL